MALSHSPSLTVPTALLTNPLTDPWFHQLALGTLAVSLASFLLMALPWIFIAWLYPAPLRRFKVQSTPFEIHRWFWPSLRQLAVNAGVMTILLVLSWPLMRLLPIHTGPLPPVWLIVLQLGFFLLLDDALYYGMHRLMHRGWLLRQFEAVDPHCGYQLPRSPLHWLPGYDGAGYHDFHHAKYKGNYAGFFGYLDRWPGTPSPGFAAWVKARSRRAP